MQNESQQWTTIIKPRTGWFDINLKEVWKYRDLIQLFVKRDFITRYKQTLLGPVWLVITPILSTIMSTFVFGTIAGIETGTVPYFIFYMCGSTAWTYFANSLLTTSFTFSGNAGIFGKVYFPRLVMPISTVISALISLAVQFLMMIGFMIYFSVNGAPIQPVWSMMWLIPLLFVEMAMLGLGCGIILSSMTTKYRDLASLVSFGVELWRYATPVVYMVNSLPGKIKAISMWNPMSAIVEAFRYVFLGSGAGTLMPAQLLISVAETLIVLFLGVILFSRVEKTFMDTV